MAWTKPQFSIGRVDQAGELITKDISDWDLSKWDLHDQALAVVNNWRSSHAYPLQALKMTLRDRAKKIDSAALIAQRIKRIPAIQLKLEANPNMKLSKMHDIGGCRAVVNNVSTVEQLVKIYEEANAKNPKRAGEFVKKYDYITHPKNDGYRGVHLVYKFFSSSPSLKPFVGLRIEIQVRSKLQHAWATAVETVDAFTGQALKSNIGELSWKRFFALMSGAIAGIERRPAVPDTPPHSHQLESELKSLWEQVHVLEGITKASEQIEQGQGDIFLLVLDSKKKTLKVSSFVKGQIAEAEKMYLEVEKFNKYLPEMQAVLVSVDSIATLRKAYPNYFLDIGEFVKTMREVIIKPLVVLTGLRTELKGQQVLLILTPFEIKGDDGKQTKSFQVMSQLIQAQKRWPVIMVAAKPDSTLFAIAASDEWKEAVRERAIHVSDLRPVPIYPDDA